MKSNKESIKLATYIHKFLNEYVPLEKTHSPCTLKSYQDALRLYISFLEKEKSIIPDKLNSDCFCVRFIEEWLLWLQNTRNCSGDTCNNRLASMRVFLKYLGKEDISYLYLFQEASQIERKRTTTKKITGMSKDAITSLLEAPDITTKAGRRDLTLMTTLYSTAARIDEILSMKVENLKLDVPKPCITIVGKGSKIRTLYLTKNTVLHLKAYLKEFHGNTPNPSSYVFFSRNSGDESKITQAAISKRLKLHAANAHKICKDVPLNLHAHQLRHAKASHWLAAGMNIVQISFLLGHAQLQTTMIYLDITLEDEAKALQTIESEGRNISKKWHNNKSTLSGFCGF